MRPVNLIPPEDRRGESVPLRTGPLAYAIVGVLAIALVAITAIVLTGNSISEKETELADIEAREAAARHRAEALAPYAEFQVMSKAREATVAQLAQSRFDWERVLRELSRVITDDVWLVSATGTAAPEVQIEGAGAIQMRDEVAGPALELVGCGSSQNAVAEFVAALNDIDGVTRVALASSERDDSAGASQSSEGGGGEDCRTRDFIAQFEIVVAFDAAPTPATAAAEGLVPPATDGATAETNSAAEQTAEAGEAAPVVTGGGAQ